MTNQIRNEALAAIIETLEVVRTWLVVIAVLLFVIAGEFLYRLLTS